MEQQSIQKTIISLIKQSCKTLLLYSVFLVIFVMISCLYEMPFEAVLYGSILMTTAVVIFILIDSYQYYKKHLILSKQKAMEVIDLSELPKPYGQLEEDYQEVLKKLFHEKKRSVSALDNKYLDMIDYYTLWAHQIKVPIAAMKMLLQVEELPKGSELLQELFKIEQYVEMVLQYLRMECMTSDLAFSRCSVDKMVKQAVKKYSSVFIYKKIKLQLKGLDMTIVTDEKWFVFVIEQLLSNALKYTKEGQISIYLEGDTVLVIEDTGIGIQGEDIPRIFEKGFTGFNGRMDKKSTGIGLYLCRQILDKLNYSIEIESEAGEGTKVKLDISIETDS